MRALPREGLRLPMVAALMALILCSAASAAEPAPLLWEIRGETPSWILGTIHLPDPRLHELPPAVSAALDGCDAYYGELKMDAVTVLKASARTMLPEGRTLRQELPPELAARATAYVERKGRDMALFDRFTVWAFMMQLTLLDQMEQFLTTAPLDLELYQRAAAAGKETGGLETLDEQLAVFDTLTPAESARLLAWTLDDLEAAEESGTSPTDAMLAAYLDGDLERLVAMAQDSVDEETPLGRKFERLLVIERNERMAERIARLIREHPGTSYLFAVGALHASGEHGLPALLQAAGFDVSRVGSGSGRPAAAGEPAPAAR